MVSDSGANKSNPANIDDVDVREVWQRLKDDPGAQMIDVRTQAELAFVGFPDLSSIGKQLLCIEWQQFPGGTLNPDFPDHVQSALTQYGLGPDTELFFICRSGQRSLRSAEAVTAVGFRRCHNVADGFEGPKDDNGHRGLVAGWKASGLPWVQK